MSKTHPNIRVLLLSKKLLCQKSFRKKFRTTETVKTVARQFGKKCTIKGVW